MPDIKSRWSSLSILALGCAGVFACRHYWRRRSTKYGNRKLDEAKRKQKDKQSITLERGMLLVTDLDVTLVGEDPAWSSSLEAFNDFWISNQVPRGSILCYNTGRSLYSYIRLVQKTGTRLLRPDVLICGDGTAVYWFTDGEREPRHDFDFEKRLRESYDRKQVARAFAKIDHLTSPLPESARPWDDVYRHSVVVRTLGLAQQLSKTLHEDLSSEMYRIEYCSGREHLGGQYWLACSPSCAGKGAALEYVRRQLRVPRCRTMCAGDSGNDTPMFALQNRTQPDEEDHAHSGELKPLEVIRGVMVANYAPELRDYHQQHPTPYRLLSRHLGAAAILEGITAFGF